VARRKADDQAFQLALRDTVELFSDNLVVATLNKLRPHLLDELNKVALALFLLFYLVVTFEESNGFGFLLVRKNIKIA